MTTRKKKSRRRQPKPKGEAALTSAVHAALNDFADAMVALARFGLEKTSLPAEAVCEATACAIASQIVPIGTKNWSARVSMLMESMNRVMDELALAQTPDGDDSATGKRYLRLVK